MRRMLLLILVCFLFSTAAADTPGFPDVTISLSQTVFSAPGPVGVTITVTAAQDMAGPCALYNPDGVRVTDFGTPTLSAGESAVWSGTWQVTPEQLAAERIVFALLFCTPDENGAPVLKQQPYAILISRADTAALHQHSTGDLQERALQLLAEAARQHMTPAAKPGLN